MATKHGEVVAYSEGFPPTNSHNPLIMPSCDKWQTLHIHYLNTYGHQTCQGGDILQGASTHKFK